MAAKHRSEAAKWRQPAAKKEESGSAAKAAKKWRINVGGEA